MSIKTLIQFCIISVIFLIIGWVYLEYFKTNKKIVEEIVPIETNINQLEKKISDLEMQNKELKNVIKNEKKVSNLITNQTTNEKTNNKKNLDIKNELDISNKKANENKTDKNENIEKITNEEKKEVKDLMKDVEYTSIDQKGNKFHLLATSGRSNQNNKDILDLENVRGKITSEIRDTIYIVSDYAQYNSINLNSNFYENVIINYQNKQITCINFDINMETNKAIAYNNVIITDPKSIMKAGIVEFDLKTKDIVINPESSTVPKMERKVKVITN